MSYDFYVIEGKKFIDYKPTVEHYEKALMQMIQRESFADCDLTFRELKTISPSKMDKYLFLLIKSTKWLKTKTEKENEELVYIYFERISLISQIIGLYTPREFMRLFPISKDYDGEKTGTKDYFYCMEYIRKIGIDTPIGEKASEFLMEYWNRDINLYVCKWMNIVTSMDIIQTGRDSMLDFFEENGLHFTKMHQEGRYMVNEETGERFKIAKPKKPMRKLFSVV